MVNRSIRDVAGIGRFIERLGDTLRQPYPLDLELKTNVPFGVVLILLILFYILHTSAGAEPYVIKKALLHGLVSGGTGYLSSRIWRQSFL